MALSPELADCSGIEPADFAAWLTSRGDPRPWVTRSHLVITPETGRPRRVFAAEFLRVAQLIGSGSREELLTVTFNVSYLQAVVDDLESTGRTARDRA